jgi:hypothetical protein
MTPANADTEKLLALARNGDEQARGHLQPLADLAGTRLPTFVQRQVGSAGVLAGVRPGRVAVPGEEQPWQIG